MASLGGRTAPGDTIQGVTPEGKRFLWANLQRIVAKRGRTGKKGVEWHPGGGETRVKAIKSDSDSDSDEVKMVVRFWEEERRRNQGWHRTELATKKRSPGFLGKNRVMTPSVAAPDVTHPSDAIENIQHHSTLSQPHLKMQHTLKSKRRNFYLWV